MKQHLLPAPHPLYQLSVTDEILSWNIEMKVEASYLSTRNLPSTLSLVTEYIPSILHCDCFNEDNRPFEEEVAQTELGHLFEHILLEYLCIAKLEKGYDSAEFSGNTSWNWKKEPRGSFHITISKEQRDSLYFNQAFAQSVGLLNKILATASIPPRMIN